MPPRPVSLALAGRNLTSQPEGYNRKKELQVKQWLGALPDQYDVVSQGTAAPVSDVSAWHHPAATCTRSKAHPLATVALRCIAGLELLHLLAPPAYVCCPK